MRIADNFIFVHMPKTGGTWLREALEYAHINMFLSSSLVGRLFAFMMKINRRLEKSVLKFIYPMIILEYSHHKLSDIPQDLLKEPIYKKRAVFHLFFRLMETLGLFKQTPRLALFMVHKRRSQVPNNLAWDPNQTKQKRQILGCISNPLRWHISRYNFYKSNENNYKHLAQINKLIGGITTFDDYCQKRMMRMQAIYYLSYSSYISSKKLEDKIDNEKMVDQFQYPQDVMTWLGKKDHIDLNNSRVPKHYGLLSLFFIWFFLPDPWKIMQLKAEDYDELINSKKINKELYNCHFLQTEKLHQETYQFLRNQSYTHKSIEFILSMPAKNVSTSGFVEEDYKKYYDTKRLEVLHKQEKIIFALFPEYEEAYQRLASSLS